MTDAAAALRRSRWLLAGALLVAFLVRAPGILWGFDFPGGFRGHHVDEWTHLVHTEILINPSVRPRWNPHAYPTGLAAHVAVPHVALRTATGKMRDPVLPPERDLFATGRAVSVVYGVLTVWIVWLLARRLVPSRPHAADLAAWFCALGGLHVSQSHFFVADVPAVFWSLLASYLLLADREEEGARASRLAGAGFAVGAALAIKLALHMLAPLAFVAVLGRPRVRRCATAAAFAIAGFTVVTAMSFTSHDLLRSFLKEGLAPPDDLAIADFPRLYLVELLPSVGVPVLALALAGLALAVRAAVRGPRRRTFDVAATVVLPLVVYAFVALPWVPPFPRHMLPYFPVIFVLAACAVCAVSRPVLRRVLGGAALAWSAALVADTERIYLRDPRGDAMRWIAANVPKGSTVWWPAYNVGLQELGHVRMKFPQDGEPDLLVAEAYRINHWLSGTGLRDSRPKDHRNVFDGQSAADLEGWQAVFDGRSAYREAARFGEGYVMPEPRLSDRLLGNRSRNYLSEVVIFTKAK